MTDLEDQLRAGLAHLADEVTTPDLCQGVLRRAGLIRRRRRLTTAVAVAALLAGTALSVGAVRPPESERPVGPAVDSYFPSLRPPLPPGWTVRRLLLQRPPDAGPSRSEVVTALERYLRTGVGSAKWHTLGLPTGSGTVKTADLVQVTVLLPRSGPRLDPPVRYSRAWLLVTTGYRYRYLQEMPTGCWDLAWTRRHPGVCTAPRPARTLVGNRFDVIDAVNGMGLAAVAVAGDGRTSAMRVSRYTKPLPSPPTGSTTFEGQPPGGSSEVITSPLAGLTPTVSSRQALRAYARYAGPKEEGGERPIARLVYLWRLQPLPGEKGSGDATWHRRLVWLVTIAGLPTAPMAPPDVHGCTGYFPVDATTGVSLYYQISCPSKGGSAHHGRQYRPAGSVAR